MSWDGVSRLLCVRLDSIGDVLMTTPAIRAAAAPERHISLLTSSTATPLAGMIPEVDEVITYDPPWMKHPPRSGRPEIDLAMIEGLRERDFDAAVIFTVYSQTPLPAATICFLAGIPLRLAHSKDKPYGLLTHWVPDPEPEAGIRHEVQRQLDLVGTVGWTDRGEGLSLRVPVEAERVIDRILESSGITTGTNWLLLHPGASAPSRRYPVQGYREVAARLARERGVRVVVTGKAEERGLAQTITRGIEGSVSLAGRLSLAELAALIGRAPLVLTNNTGPAHIAAALGTPVVVLYALTNPQHTPWAVRSIVLSNDVPCRNCQSSICPLGHHDCLGGVSPDRVLEAVDTFDVWQTTLPGYAETPVSA